MTTSPLCLPGLFAVETVRYRQPLDQPLDRPTMKERPPLNAMYLVPVVQVATDTSYRPALDERLSVRVTRPQLTTHSLARSPSDTSILAR